MIVESASSPGLTSVLLKLILLPVSWMLGQVTSLVFTLFLGKLSALPHSNSLAELKLKVSTPVQVCISIT